MGIKFLCPNGHKLNVKSFLAGKKGVCPKCGVSLRIPAASESDLEDSGVGLIEPSPSEALVATVATSAAKANGTMPSPAGPVVMPGVPTPKSPAPGVSVPIGPAVPVGTPVAGMPAPQTPSPAIPVQGVPVPGSSQPTIPQAIPGYAGTMPQPNMAPHPAMTPQRGMPQPGIAQPGYGHTAPAVYGPGDPIAEAPGATWYVRPPSGNQYGPARGDVMRKWIAEGRVSADSLVWREGWADWRNAGQVFPNLATAGGPSAPVVPTSASTTRASTRYQPRKKSGTGMAVAFLVLLALACIVLVGVLVYVLSTQAAS